MIPRCLLLRWQSMQACRLQPWSRCGPPVKRGPVDRPSVPVQSLAVVDRLSVTGAFRSDRLAYQLTAAQIHTLR